MPRPRPAIKRVPVLLRLAPDVLAFIDSRRGALSRAAYIERAVIQGARPPGSD